MTYSFLSLKRLQIENVHPKNTFVNLHFWCCIALFYFLPIFVNIFAITVSIIDNVLTFKSTSMCAIFSPRDFFFLSRFVRGSFDGKEKMVTGCQYRQVRTNKSTEAYKNLLNNSQPNHGHMHTDRRWWWTKGVFYTIWLAGQIAKRHVLIFWMAERRLTGWAYLLAQYSYIYLVVLNGAKM